MNSPITYSVEIYTDGSCHTQLCIGGWAAIVFIGGEKFILSGKEKDTTHNRMEILAVIKAVELVKKKCKTVSGIKIISDSQYVIGLESRKEKFIDSNFKTKKGNEIRNEDLVRKLLRYTEEIKIDFVKIKAHQKKNGDENFNIEADKLSRKIVRDAVKEIRSS